MFPGALPNINNNSFEISQYINKKAILLEYWASWCQPCRKSFPQLREINNKYGPDGLEIIAVAWMEIDNATWHKAIEEESISDWHHAAAVFQDGGIINIDFMDTFAITGIPFSVLIDKSGRVAGYWEGYWEENELELEAKLKELL